ncbi:MAG: IS3 family transposase [Pseudonocardiaceae bacterium]
MTTEIQPTRSALTDRAAPDPEVVERARRRTFTAEYRMRIVREAEACREKGQIGALLRREGLYSSHLTEWRKQRDQAGLAALGRSRGRKPKYTSAEREAAQLRRDNDKLRKDLAAARMVIDVQKNGLSALGDRPRERGAEERSMIDASVSRLAPAVGTAAACHAIGINRTTVYRWRAPRAQTTVPRERAPSPRALSTPERAAVLEVLHSERFINDSPAQVYATLLDEGTYLASQRTMYRVLAAHGEVRERRDQLRRPTYTRPELLATGPNALWSWDITRLLGPQKWTYFYLYVMLDVFSRYAVGWMLAHRESAVLAERFIADTCAKQEIARDTLTIHADRGSSMTSKPVALLMADLGVTKSHSRPHVSNDNPFSESQFKTMKYRPEFPDRFGCIEDGRAFCSPFFHWYNTEHRHSGLGLHTPASVHYGLAAGIREQRATVLAAAYAAHPERFIRATPQPPALPTSVWINPPAQEVAMVQ